MSNTRWPAPRAVMAASLSVALGALVAGCGNAHGRVTHGSPNLVVFNGTERTVKVYVVHDEDVDVGELVPMHDIDPGGYGAFKIHGGKHTVITERFGHGHDPHRRLRVHFRGDEAHVLRLGAWTDGAAQAIVQRLVAPGTVVHWPGDASP